MKNIVITTYLLASSLIHPTTIAATSKAIVTPFDEIRLTPENEIAPFVGTEFAYGMADVSIEFDASRSTKWRICVSTHIEGFIPGLLQIVNGEIFENGNVVVDFSDLLTDHHYVFHGCHGITKTLYDQMISQPEKFYVSAHVAEEPEALAMMAIRGQFVQKFTVNLAGSKEVTPFKGAKNTAGKATISFEAAGKVACFDVSFFKASKNSSVPASPFLLAQVHLGAKGTNGAVVLEFSPTRVSSERFFGCLTLKELGVNHIQIIADLLADPTNYYVNAHVGKSGTADFNVGVRGQLEYFKF